MRLVLTSVLILLVLSVTAVAIHDYYYQQTDQFEGYSGERAAQRRLYDSASRQRYFGSDYSRPFSNFGSKGPTYRVTNTGAKSAFSSVFNLDTNAFRPRGRDPSKISNWDPNIRGFATLDIQTPLLPTSLIAQRVGNEYTLAKGTARIVSISEPYGAILSKPYPRTQVQIHVTNLPPLPENEVYEAWLIDEDTGYSLSIGLFQSDIELTGHMIFEMRRGASVFEGIMVTKEPYPDPDPRPANEILIGYFGPTRNILQPDPSLYQRLR